MKKRWALVILLGTIAVLVYGMFGSGAWFTSTATSTDNKLTAATLKLEVDGVNSVARTYVLDNIKPGDWALAGQAPLKNVGTLPGKLWFEIVNVTPSDGPLGALVYPKFQQNVAPWTRFGGDKVINLSVGERVDIMELAAGESIPIVAYFSWPQGPNDNSAQGASLTFDVIWHLDQIP